MIEREHSDGFCGLIDLGVMRIASLTGLLGVLCMTACGSSSSGSESAGETTAASSSAGTESSTGETGEPMDCGTVIIHGEYIPSRVMFVIDTSSSMLALWDHDGDPNTPTQSRWASARELVEVVASSGPGPAVLGLQRFPSADANACAVAEAPELPLAEQDADALLAALPGPNAELVGASPAAAAYASALEHVLDERRGPIPTYMVLLTDGRMNCGAELESYDEELFDLVEDAYAQEIRTIVIAIDEAADPLLEDGPDVIPDFDPRPALHELGLLGGAHVPNPVDAAYFSASAPEALASVLGDQIISDPSCEFDLTATEQGPPTAEQIELVTWTINGEPIPYIEPDACASQAGWTWVELGEVVRFCGDACEAMQEIEAVIEGRYGCP